jgi:hypothetical protein
MPLDKLAVRIENLYGFPDERMRFEYELSVLERRRREA